MIHTEILESRIAQVFASIEAGIVTIADAEFLVELVKRQAQMIEEMHEDEK